eukprot:XP_001706350.1 Hypothetical protein GL50803_37601 [Giardia lamblia ATCC 50803]
MCMVLPQEGQDLVHECFILLRRRVFHYLCQIVHLLLCRRKPLGYVLIRRLCHFSATVAKVFKF